MGRNVITIVVCIVLFGAVGFLWAVLAERINRERLFFIVAGWSGILVLIIALSNFMNERYLEMAVEIVCGITLFRYAIRDTAEAKHGPLFKRKIRKKEGESRDTPS